MGRHVLSTVSAPLGCLFGNQGKAQKELSGKYSQVPLFPLPLKGKAEQSPLTFFCIQQSFFLVLRTVRCEISGTTAVSCTQLPMVVCQRAKGMDIHMRGTYSCGVVGQISFLWDKQKTGKYSPWMDVFKRGACDFKNITILPSMISSK